LLTAWGAGRDVGAWLPVQDHFDYKAATVWDEKDKKACCEFVKDILAMANTQGGFIAVGVSEQSGGFTFDGLTDTQADSFETSRLNRFLQNYTEPPINTLLRKIAHDGKSFVLIEVPPFPSTPHICQKEYPGTLTAPTLYVRTDNNESAPVRSFRPGSQPSRSKFAFAEPSSARIVFFPPSHHPKRPWR